VNQPGNREITTADLRGGELPAELPLEGWQSLTLHCQVDAIGPSDRHPDLVKLELSIPPEKPPEPVCSACGDRRVVPAPYAWRSNELPEVLACPECSACTATVLHALYGRVQCSLLPGHYNEKASPTPTGDGELWPAEPGGWHQSGPERDGTRMCWNDKADGATPHGEPPRPAMPLERSES
jgi:hypothetical protein